MRLHSYSSEGIILARKNYGEADRILTIYSRDNGRMSLIAKGVRRPKSKKRGHIEVFSLVKFQAITGRGLDIMTEVEVVDNFSEVRKSLKKISLAYYLSEVIGKITHESEPNNTFFDLIYKTFEKLKTTKALRKLRIDFVISSLILLGFWPEGGYMTDPDQELEGVIERRISSVRVGERMIK